MKIVTSKNILRKVSSDVTQVPTGFINDFKRFVANTRCAALSAIQVGNASRIFIVKVDNELLVFINPEIIEKSGKQSSEETCLSVPNVRVKRERSRAVTVKAYDENMNEFYFRAINKYAAIMEHEIDHLNGITIQGE